jgi:hypothetical protein
MKYTELIHMIIGHHFRKHKPEWNFFTNYYQSLIDNSTSTIFKLLILSFGVQILFFIPVMYWIFQNYEVLQTLIPKAYDLGVNLEFEKKWIVFLILTSVAVSSAWNAFIWFNFYKFKALAEQQARINDQTASRDEAADLRLVS